MRYVFLISFLMLCAISLTWAWLMPEQRSDLPVLYWVTDANPAREEQVRLFHQWLDKNGYPPVELRLDTANEQESKKVIQGVSGVAGDIIDLGATEMPYFQALGVLEDMTHAARRLGFTPQQTWSTISSQLVVDGRQYRFPCNVFSHLYWINLATLEKCGQQTPPRQWDADTFERLGKQFVAAANSPGQRHPAFFADTVDHDVLRRSAGVDIFNETLTRCTLDDPRAAAALQRLHQWTYRDRILPTPADLASLPAEAGYRGQTLQLFNSGNYAMVRSGRYALIQFRQFGSLRLAVSHPPYLEFENALAGTRAAAVYAGSEHKEQAELFLAFLASEDYNMHVVKDADALPPNPLFTRTEAFLRPAEYPNEWGCHEAFADAAESIALPASTSPFVLPSVVTRIDSDTSDAFLRSGRLSAAQAGREAARQINAEIQLALQENPRLREQYQEAIERQKRIEQQRAQGKIVPLEWISNPFHRAYYRSKGWAQ